MLTYLISTTRAIVMASVILGVMVGYTQLSAEKLGKKIIFDGILVGTVLSIIIAAFRNNTSKVNSANLNATIYIVGLASLFLFLIFGVSPLAKKNNKAIKTISWVTLAVLAADIIVYSFPEVWAYPHQVLLSEKTIISTDFLTNMIGMVLGIILALLGYMAAKKSTERISVKGALVLLVTQLGLRALQQLAGILSVLQQRRIIVSNHTIFTFIVFIKNHSDGFIITSLLLVVAVTIVLWIRSFKVKEPYRNPAEHRIIRAKWRNIRRWSTTMIMVFVLTIITVTVFEKLNTREVVLSPIEETDYDDVNVYVPFEMVSDGHLHRFAYTTDDGVQIRFIVIQKPNSSAYGIGLDACEICGETGYYERDGQVVCKLCDVVMNINTIGFKGGCNPIVIPYEINDGRIIVPIEGLLEYKSEFK